MEKPELFDERLRPIWDIYVSNTELAEKLIGNPSSFPNSREFTYTVERVQKLIHAASAFLVYLMNLRKNHPASYEFVVKAIQEQQNQ